MPAPEPCIVSPKKYCLSGPLPCSSFCRAMYCLSASTSCQYSIHTLYAEKAPGLFISNAFAG
jgi:hypothetical protein